MGKHQSNLIYKRSKKSICCLFLCTAILFVSIGTLSGCSSSQPSAGSDKSSDSGTQTVSDADPSTDTPVSGNSDSADDPLRDIDLNEPIDLSDESWSVITLAYIHGLEDDTLAFDAVEWVDVPSNRAKELGIEDEYLDTGFYVHNEDVHIENLPLAEDCRCILYGQTDSDQPAETDIKDLPAIFKERKDANIPYELTIQNQKITNIQEHYLP